MDCTICLDVKIDKKEMEHLDCGHVICKCCYKKLVRNLCPFCRQVISNKEDGIFDLDNNLTEDTINDIYNNNYQIDNVLPQSQLDNIINDDIYSTYYTNEEVILRKLNKRKCKKNSKRINFISNKEREPWERKSKKNKKQRRVNNIY